MTMEREELIKLICGMLETMPPEDVQTIYIFALHYCK